MHFISIQFLYNIVQYTEQLIQNVFPQISTNNENHERLCEVAILTEKNNDGNAVNNIIKRQILGKYTVYKSIDTIMNTGEIVNYPIEFCNSLDISGISQNVLSLKIGTPIIPLRNINPPRMCNET